MDALNKIQGLFQSQAYAKAAAEAARALESGNFQKDRRPLLATLCISLAAIGRQDEAAEKYARYMQGWRLEDALDLDIALTASIAARQREHTEWLYHLRFPDAHYRKGRIVISPITATAQWCAGSGADFRMIDHAIEVDVASEHHWRYVTAPYFEACIPRAEIVCGWDYVVTPTGDVLSDSGYSPLSAKFMQFFPQVAVDQLSLVAHPWPEDVVELDCEALFLSTPERFHFGHFIVDFLPRLRVLSNRGRGTKVAIPTETPAKFRDLLALFGLRGERLVECDLGRRYRFRSLVVAMPGNGLRPNPGNVRFIREVSRPAPSEAVATGRFFVERNVGSRQIANRAEVDAVLAEYGIQHVDLSRLSISAQRELLGCAKLVVGVFGSDLLSAYFLPDDAHMIEIIWATSEDPVIGPSCAFSGIRHRFLVSSKAPTTRFRQYKKDSDVLVDCNELRRMLAEITG